MMRKLPFLLAFAGCLSASLSGCDSPVTSACDSVSESIYVNERNPAAVEPYSPDSVRVFTFEYAFKDTVAVAVNNRTLARAYLLTGSNGLAGQFLIKVQLGEEVVISTGSGCARFKLRDGYKYLYINRLKKGNWAVAYSNYGRGYF